MTDKIIETIVNHQEGWVKYDTNQITCLEQQLQNLYNDLLKFKQQIEEFKKFIETVQKGGSKYENKM